MKTRLQLLEEHIDAINYELVGAEIRLTLADSLRLRLVKPEDSNMLAAIEEGRAKTIFDMQKSESALRIVNRMIEEEKKKEKAV